jgi:RNA polymerase sigma factor (sigma-70 family)
LADVISSSGLGVVMEVGELVRLAASGERAAWESLVERYEGLLWGVARSHRLDAASASDVVQTTWLKLLEHVDELRNPDALSGWLATTARNECLRVLRHQARTIPTEDDRIPEDSMPSNLDAQLLERERDAALWRAFATLSARCQTLLRMLASDPAPTYDDVSAALGMPIGSIGPTRGRCLETLRRAMARSRITPVPPGSYH